MGRCMSKSRWFRWLGRWGFRCRKVGGEEMGDMSLEWGRVRGEDREVMGFRKVMDGRGMWVEKRVLCIWYMAMRGSRSAGAGG